MKKIYNSSKNTEYSNIKVFASSMGIYTTHGYMRGKTKHKDKKTMSASFNTINTVFILANI